jgi:hypothetical protein
MIIKKISVYSILIFLLSTHSYSQPDKNSIQHNWWINGGLGASSIGNFSAYSSLNYTAGSNIFKVRSYTSGDFMEISEYSVEEYGLLYGYYLENTEIASLSFMFGLSYLHLREKGDFISTGFIYDNNEYISHDIIGIPLEMQLNLNIFKYAGLSLVLYGNVNYEMSLVGVNLNLMFGNLK